MFTSLNIVLWLELCIVIYSQNNNECMKHLIKKMCCGTAFAAAAQLQQYIFYPSSNKIQYHGRIFFVYQFGWSMQQTMCSAGAGNAWHHDLDDQTATRVTVPKITIALLKLFFDLNLAISILSLSIVLWLELCIEIYDEIPNARFTRNTTRFLRNYKFTITLKFILQWEFSG